MRTQLRRSGVVDELCPTKIIDRSVIDARVICALQRAARDSRG